jgi:hypothetical protein
MNILIDPDVSGDGLWQQLYAGHLVILTRLRALNDFVSSPARRSPSCSGRTTPSMFTSTSTRPGAIDHKPDQELVVLPAPGEVLLFSGNQLHASIPNTSGRARFSVDFRTVDLPDLMAGRGAPFGGRVPHGHRDYGTSSAWPTNAALTKRPW